MKLYLSLSSNAFEHFFHNFESIDFASDTQLPKLSKMGALSRLGSLPFSRDRDSQQVRAPAPCRRTQTRAFKLAPPVTTEPPPRRLTLPEDSTPPLLRQDVRSLSSAIIVPARTTPGLSPANVTLRRSQDVQSSRSLPIINDTQSRQVPPPLPPREDPTLQPSSDGALVLAIIDSPPSLPPRTKSPANPPLPPRNYRKTSAPAMNATIEGKTAPAKIQRVPSTSPPGNSQYNLSRLDSSMSTSSADSVVTTTSNISSASSVATAPSVSAKSSHIAELIKVLESKKAPPPPPRGVAPIRPLQ